MIVPAMVRAPAGVWLFCIGCATALMGLVGCTAPAARTPVVAPAASAPPLSAEELAQTFSRAFELKEKHEDQAAYDAFSRVIAAARATLAGQGLKLADPNKLLATGLLMRADIATDLRRWNEAIADIGETLTLMPLEAYAYAVRAHALEALGRLDEAQQDFTQAALLEPEAPLWRTERGMLRSDRGDVAGALEDFNAALAIQPGYSLALLCRGHAFEELGDLPRAAADYESLVAREGQEASSYVSRGEFHQRQGRYPEALADYEAAYRIDQYNMGAAVFRHLLRLRLGIPSDVGVVQRAAVRAKDAWWITVADFLAGKIGEGAFRGRISPDPTRRNGQLCDVLFYSGMRRLLAGDREGARVRFAEAAALPRMSSAEWAFAVAELRRLPEEPR